MEDDTTTNDDVPTDNQHDSGDDRSARAGMLPLSNYPELRTTVDVAVPSEIVADVADRAAQKTASDGAVTPVEVAGLVADHVEVQPQYLVAGTDTPLVKALADRADVTIDSPEDAPDAE